MRPDDPARRALELQPGEIAGPSAHERLRKGQKHDEQPRRRGVELRLDPRPQHVGKRDAKRAAKHEIRNDAQDRQKDSETEKKEGEREPLDAAQIVGDFRLRRRIDRLEKAFAENPVINDRLVDEPTEARRAVDLSAPFRRPGRAEENKMLEAEHRFRFAVAFLLFAKCA